MGILNDKEFAKEMRKKIGGGNRLPPPPTKWEKIKDIFWMIGWLIVWAIVAVACLVAGLIIFAYVLEVLR